MFYSHQLLARKAPLGQIWMAATMHAKINRRKLDQIDIIKICEEILNPSVPMALRLSGILMGGVVIVYERKVKLLYDDVTRFMLQLNEAWKVKPAQDPTLLPKGKTQAKFEAVTLPEIGDTGLGDMEESVDFSNKIPAMGFEQTAYFSMRLNNVHEVNEKIMEEELNQQQHQADAANITLFDAFDPYQANSGPYNHFERFDIEGDEETHMNFPSQEHTDILTPPAISPQQHSQRGPSVVDDILYQHVEHPVNQPSDECRETRQQPQPQSREEVQKQVKTKRKAKRPLPFIMDDELTIIPGYLYQSWLQSSADLLSRRGKNRKYGTRPSNIKIANLMDVPPAALACGLIESSTWQVHYPRPILELWMRSIQPPQDTPSGGTTPPHPPEPSSSSPLANVHYRGEFHNGPGSESLSSIEKQMRAPAEGPVHVPDMELMSTGHGVNEPNLMATPTSFGNHVSSASFLNSGTGPVFSSNDADGNSTRSSKKRPFSSSRNGGGLETVDEEIQWTHQEIDEPIFTLIEEQPEPRSKQARRSKHGPTIPDYELLVETGPTQTQAPLINDELENMTRSIKTHLKTYFETPGAPQTESLNQLADGMNKRRAAQLFYQTCVLATRDFLRVQQTVAYGDIFISRGAKM